MTHAAWYAWFIFGCGVGMWFGIGYSLWLVRRERRRPWWRS